MDYCKGKIVKLLVDYFVDDYQRMTHTLEVLRHAELKVLKEADRIVNKL